MHIAPAYNVSKELSAFVLDEPECKRRNHKSEYDTSYVGPQTIYSIGFRQGSHNKDARNVNHVE